MVGYHYRHRQLRRAIIAALLVQECFFSLAIASVLRIQRVLELVNEGRGTIAVIAKQIGLIAKPIRIVSARLSPTGSGILLIRLDFVIHPLGDGG